MNHSIDIMSNINPIAVLKYLTTEATVDEGLTILNWLYFHATHFESPDSRQAEGVMFVLMRLLPLTAQREKSTAASTEILAYLQTLPMLPR